MFWKALMIWIIAGTTAPFVMTFFDGLCNPTTGTLVAIHAPEWQIALLSAIPWVYPIGLFIYGILVLAGKDSPNIPGGQ